MLRKTQLWELYCSRKLSMAEVAKKLGITHATVLYWLKKHGISRRPRSESSYVKQNPNGNPFTIPSRLTSKQQELLKAALLLYWAEGSKTNGVVRIVNLDARMVQLFIKFLREVCHADEKRLSVYVRVHSQFNLGIAKRYWSHGLRLPTSRVFVYPHTDHRSKASAQWSRYGLATLEFHNTKFKQWLHQSIEQYINRLLGASVSVGRRAPSPLGPTRFS